MYDWTIKFKINNQTEVVLTHNIDTQGIQRAIAGNTYVQAQTGQLLNQRLYEIGRILTAPTRTTTNAKGHSQGGAYTATNTQYKHTVTNSEAFSTGESWGTATAVDSTHAADFWFSYKVSNTGTEYAREIANLAFNLYIGDDPDPAYTYFIAPDIGGSGKFQNFMPNKEHQSLRAAFP